MLRWALAMSWLSVGSRLTGNKHLFRSTASWSPVNFGVAFWICITKVCWHQSRNGQSSDGFFTFACVSLLRVLAHLRNPAILLQWGSFLTRQAIQTLSNPPENMYATLVQIQFSATSQKTLQHLTDCWYEGKLMILWYWEFCWWVWMSTTCYCSTAQGC